MSSAGQSEKVAAVASRPDKRNMLSDLTWHVLAGGLGLSLCCKTG